MLSQFVILDRGDTNLALYVHEMFDIREFGFEQVFRPLYCGIWKLQLAITRFTEGFCEFIERAFLAQIQQNISEIQSFGPQTFVFVCGRTVKGLWHRVLFRKYADQCIAANQYRQIVTAALKFTEN